MNKRETVRSSDWGLLFFILAFFGWLLEFIFKAIFLKNGKNSFLNLPFCPIYALSSLTVYSILDTPKNFISSHTNKKQYEFLYLSLYIIFCQLVIIFFNCFIGYFTRTLFKTNLWSSHVFAVKQNRFSNIISFDFGIVFVFLTLLIIDKLLNIIKAIPLRIAKILFFILIILTATDYAISLFKVILSLSYL